MDLSVIILNFNVSYLLEDCLESVSQAIQAIEAEIIVVDNASTDESVDMVLTQYPGVRLLTNTINVGFAAGNNRGVALATGKYILILNPDTIINEKAVLESLRYLKGHPDTGGIGVKMINGYGKYLKESKRGFPDLMSSLFKLSGLNRIFPHHDRINRYYLGNLSEEGIHEVDVLTGAYLMMPGALYSSLGGFDEHFFMYGEDIDLSYRIRQRGKKLIYLGIQQIIHLKGRSTNEYSFQHVHDFYQAMSVFVKKYQFNAVLKFVMLWGIKLTMISSWIKRQVVNHFLPIADLISIGLILVSVQQLWASAWFKTPSYFHHGIFLVNALSYVLIWMGSLFMFNTYHPLNQYKTQNTLQAVLSGTFIILIIYALLPDSLRSSRAVILWSGLWIAILLPGLRKFLSVQGNGYRGLYLGSAGNEKIHHELFKRLVHHDFFSYLSRLDWSSAKIPQKLNDELKSQRITHILLDKQNTNYEDVLSLSYRTRNQTALLYVHVQHDLPLLNASIPGMTAADIRLTMIPYRIIKRLINIATCILILPWGWIRKDIRTHYFSLLTGKMQFAGYQAPTDPQLPSLLPAIWSNKTSLLINIADPAAFNFEYAQHYSPGLDIKIILHHLFNFV